MHLILNAWWLQLDGVSQGTVRYIYNTLSTYETKTEHVEDGEDKGGGGRGGMIMSSAMFFQDWLTKRWSHERLVITTD